MKWTNCGDRTWKRKHRNPAITLEVKKWGGEYTPIVEIHGHPVFLLNQPTLALAHEAADLLSTDKEQGAKGAEIKAELVRRFGEAK